jgi:hypothetical protein
MQAAPINPLTASQTVAAIGAPDATHGWTFDTTTGVIHGISVDKTNTALETDDGVTDINGNLIAY